jgi:plastocyanin
MSKSYLWATVVVVVVIAGGLIFMVTRSDDKSTSSTSNSSQTQNTPEVANNNSDSDSQSSDQTPTTGKIDITTSMIFTPSQITVKKGGTVTWTNNDSTAHTVTADLENNGGPASGNIEPGQTYTFTFDKTGSFQYHCQIHPAMRGTIVVKD